MANNFAYVALVLTMACAACSSPVYQSPAGGTQQQFKADLAQCNAQANMASLGTGGFTGLAIFTQQQRLCMEGRGYTLVNK